MEKIDKTKLLSEYKALEKQLQDLYECGANDEDIVDRMREIKKELNKTINT